MTDILLQINNLGFSYSKASSPQISIKSLEIKKGEKIFLHGSSGCGKTTLLELIGGVLQPQKGTISFLNQDLTAMGSTKLDQMRAHHMGYIFQSFNLIPYLSILENVLLPLSFSQHKKQKVADPKKQALYMLERLGLKEYSGKMVSALSVGQQQRVAAARALIGSPELILADEPTSALDLDHRQKFIELLFELTFNSESSILFVSHDHTLEKYFDRSISFAQLQGV